MYPILTLKSINKYQKDFSVITKTKVRGNNTRPRYRLDKELTFQLSNGVIIYIPQGFIWDLASVPRFLWSFLPPDGDYEVAYLIHDYLWIEKDKMKEVFKKDNKPFSRKFTDREMYKWAKVTNGTDKISLRNIDNLLRYKGVRWFGKPVWDGSIILK